MHILGILWSLTQNVLESLADGQLGVEYVISGLDTGNDTEMKSFLMSLGCYAGEKITVISVCSNLYIVNIKNARYSIDKDLAAAIRLFPEETIAKGACSCDTAHISLAV